jgi:Bacterial DNA-binding protein
VKRRKRRNGFRQSGADWETAAACVKMETESSVLIRPLFATPAPGVSRSRLITKHLKKGERIRIAGLGILQVRKRAARMGRNPATGEAIKIGASKKVAFRASKELKEAI